MRHLHAVAALAVVLAALGLLVAPAARAEPYLMVRAGAKCSDCHTNMTGGGKRTSFAHIHARDILHDLDLLPIPPTVKAFNGQLHDYVSIGMDLRARNTTVFQDTPNASGRLPANKAFRSDVTSNSWEVNEFLGYLQVDVLPDYVTLYGDWNLNGGVTNREAFGLIRGILPWDFFIKAGRFFPPFGLGVWDDTHYIRSRTGYTFTNPDEGGEIGIAPGPFFFTAAVTNSPSGAKAPQVNVNGYGLFQDVPVVRNVLAGASYGWQTDKRWVLGWYAGSNIWNFTYLAEFDLIDDRSVASEAKRDSYAAYAEIDYLAFDWLNFRGAFDFVKVSHDQNQTRYTIGIEPFINRVIQPRIEYRINNGPNNVNTNPNAIVDNQDELVFEVHLFF